MNSSAILNETMTLEEKLAAIDAAMLNAQQQAQDDAQSKGLQFVPLDPADLTMCDGCQ